MAYDPPGVQTISERCYIPNIKGPLYPFFGQSGIRYQQLQASPPRLRIAITSYTTQHLIPNRISVAKMTSITKTLHHDVYDFIDPRTTLKGAANGKSVLITGGGTGIGRATAEQFAIAGATTIFVSGRTLKSLEETAASIKLLNPTTRVIPVVADVISRPSVVSLFAKAKEELNGSSVDICVSNAGTTGEVTSTADSDPNDWWTTIEVNLKGVYLVGREFVRSAREAGRPGILINTSSWGSYWNLSDLGPYQIAKAAVNKFSEFIDLEHGKDGIRSYAYHPGSVLTGVWKHFEVKNPGVSQQLSTDTPELGAAICVFFTTPRAAWLSGRYVSANWDMEELEGMREKIEQENLLIMTVNGKRPGPPT